MEIDNPYIRDGHWYKGSFHNHSEIFSVEECVRSFIDSGYDFITMSEHDGNKKECLDYNDEIVIIPGFEQSMGWNPHVVVVNVWHDELKHIVTLSDYQNFIDECVARGGIAILAHPHWQKKDYWPEEYLDKLTGYTGIEILNTSIEYDRAKFTGEYDYWDIAVDVWDMLLSRGIKVWGFGNDDFHHRKEFAKSFNLVKAKELTRDSIMKSVEKGSFAVSTGVRLNDIMMDGETIKIDIDHGSENKIFMAFGKEGKILKSVITSDNCFYYTPCGNEDYVRLQVILESGKTLFTQPFFIKDRKAFKF